MYLVVQPGRDESCASAGCDIPPGGPHDCEQLNVISRPYANSYLWFVFVVSQNCEVNSCGVIISANTLVFISNMTTMECKMVFLNRTSKIYEILYLKIKSMHIFKHYKQLILMEI